MTLQENIVAHKIALEDKVTDAQAKLASDKLQNAVDLAQIDKNKQVAISQIQADAKVEIAGKRAVASLFMPQYNYGNPYQALAVG